MEESYFGKLFKSFKETLSPTSTEADLTNKPSYRLPNGIEFTTEELDNEVKDLTAEESGWKRVKELLSFDESMGKRPDFFTENIDIVTSTGILGFLLGSVLKTEETKHNFKNNTSLAIYTDRKAAHRAFVDYVYIQMLKGGTRIGLRFVAFSGIIVGTSSIIQAYRNKSSPLDYTLGGMVSGGLLRMHFGLYGLIAGSAVGGVFGSVFGIARHGQLRLGNTTYEDRRNQYLKDKLIQQKLMLMPIEPESASKLDNEQK